MQLGVCYYSEQWPQERWAIDAKMMREAGLKLVRLAEFAWTFMEPREAEFEWPWLDTAIEVLTGEGLKIILCTPTATPPAWLCTAHPEILPVDPSGRRRQFGSRRHYCPTSAIYRQYTGRIVTAMAERYGGHPDVVAWQIDNEFGLHDTARCYCDECAAGFRRWLRERYTTLDALNDAWGTAFWNQLYTDWDQIQPPNLTVTVPNPSHALDYYRCATDTYLSYEQLQLEILRAHVSSAPITTNFMGNFPDLDYHEIAHPVDFVSWDSYPSGYAELQAQTLYAPDDPRPAHAPDLGDPYVTGFCHDLTRGLKQAPFWVIEQQAGHVNWGRFNTGINPGAVRLWTWHAALSGADAVVYFRWRAALAGQEQYHSGLLNHDTSPGVGYHDVLRLQNDLPELQAMTGSNKPSQVALLLDYNHLWAIDLQPHREGFGYLRHLFVYYRALQQLGISVDIIPVEADLKPYRLVISPTHFLINEFETARLTTYVKYGGNLLLGVRSGSKTPTNRVTDQPLPGLLRELVGAQVKQWQSLPPGVAYDIEAQIPGLSNQVGFWTEALHADAGTEVLARYTSGPYAGAGALTQRYVEAGTASYLGFYPDLSSARALMAHIAGTYHLNRMNLLPEGLIAGRRGDSTFLLNFTDRPLKTVQAGRDINVPPRDLVKIEPDIPQSISIEGLADQS